ncbi:protein Wnt-8a-like [Diabrotica undecimpunctata]|uniref:protein Wnt-8a-like n=1 Tax=Diabrotica undecimpunctata TaxID=50387 RepID=UPI003B63DB41
MNFLVFFVIFILSVVVAVSSMRSALGSRSMSPFQIGSPSVVDSIASGTEMAIHHCQQLFQWEKWSCPKLVFSKQQRFPPTPEIAYTKAIVAAGITYSLTRNCSKGQIEGCGCDKTDKNQINLGSEEFKNVHIRKFQRNSYPSHKNVTKQVWGGCSDDTTFSSRITEKVLESLDKGLDAHAYVARHNFKIGIEVIKHTMVKKCRCHGISGSCSLQTCWMQVAPFGEISKKLKELHKKSIRVTHEDVQNSIVMGNSAREESVEEKEIPGTRNSLIYMEQSPDYCLPNPSEGYMGTKGRMCSRNKANVTRLEKNSCKNLCKKCGHRVKRLQKKVTRRCNCTFTWCCEVKCDTCVETVNEYFCV